MWLLSKRNRTSFRYRGLRRPTRSHAVADLPVGARGRLRHHRGTANLAGTLAHSAKAQQLLAFKRAFNVNPCWELCPFALGKKFPALIWQFEQAFQTRHYLCAAWCTIAVPGRIVRPGRRPPSERGGPAPAVSLLSGTGGAATGHGQCRRRQRRTAQIAKPQTLSPPRARDGRAGR